MTSFLSSAFAEAYLPFLYREPPILQYAALCHRDGPKGREILLITSSHGRWILPKGWPIDGKTGGETALQEAWEEAGVRRGEVTPKPMLTYSTVKRYAKAEDLPCEVAVYEIAVQDLVEDFPEANRRERRWVSRDEAQELVDDPALRQVLRLA